MESRNGKILVAIDGSASSLQTVRYLGGIHSCRTKQVVLFSVYTEVPDYYSDIGHRQPSLAAPGGGGSLAQIQRRNLEGELEKARQILLAGGFDGRNVSVKLQKRDMGIARDIIAEGKNGYDMVVAGRKGVGRLEGLIFGSVAAKLVEKLTFATLLLVGRDARPDKLLVAVDASEGARRVIEFFARNLAGKGFDKITLLHVMRGKGSQPDTLIREKMETTMTLMEDRLGEAVIDPGKIDHRIVQDAASRAETIVEMARRDGYGTIAIGRKGLSDVPEFSMGRVTNKVIQLGRGLAIWVVR